MIFFWFMRRWFKSRPYVELLWSIPILLAGAACLVFFYVVSGWKPVETRSRYTAVATRALAAKDYPMARVACQRLLSSGSESPGQTLFYMAIALGGLGREQEANALLSQAAPTEKPVYAPAHVYVARSLLALTNGTPKTVKLAEKHLEYAVRLEPKSTEAHELLSWICVQRRDWESARKHLLQVLPSRPQAALSLAAVLKELGDEAGAKARAEQAAKYFREKLTDAKSDMPAERVACAQAVGMLGDYQEAFSILESGWKQSGNPAYRPPLGEVCAVWAQKMAKDRPGDLAPRIKLIQQGLEYAPRNLPLLQQLADLSRLQGPAANAARDTMTRLLAEGKSSALLHYVLGGDAWQRGETEEGRKHFALAYEAGPLLPYVANNMAAMLAMGEKPDLPRALGIIKPLVEKFPQEPNFRDTRGQILVKLGRWEEAVKDLEFALPLLPVKDKSATHTALAKAYRALNMPKLAAEHERLATQPAAVP